MATTERLVADRRTLTIRALFALGLGVASAIYVLFYARSHPAFVSDIDQAWTGVRALWAQKNPYDVVGPGREFQWDWPLYYPLPALLVVSPLGLLSVAMARAVFAGTSVALFAWGITRDGWSRLPIFFTISFYMALKLCQWSILFAAAFFVSAIGAIAFAKPNFVVAVAAAASNRKSLIWIALGTAALLITSQIMQPGWHEDWLANLRAADHFKSHVTRPLGFLMLLAALKWRRPEARWLLALSLIPLPPSFYDHLLLVAVCLTMVESLVLAVSTWVLFVYVGLNISGHDYPLWASLVGNGTLWFCYLPALVMVLRRPNEGALPWRITTDNST